MIRYTMFAKNNGWENDMLSNDGLYLSNKGVEFYYNELKKCFLVE